MARPGKRAAVLCPGPSLARALPRLDAGEFDRRDLTIAVNRAAAARACDYWCIWDPESFDDCEPMGRPTIVMDRKRWQRLAEVRPAAGRHGSIVREDLATPPPSTGWVSWSATVAVVLAWNLGATEIAVLGADLAGRADFDGVSLPRQRRSPERWQRERDCWTRLIAWMHGEGVEVTRVSDPE